MVLTFFLVLVVVSALATDWNGDTLIGAIARGVFHLVLLLLLVGLVMWLCIDPVEARSSWGYWSAAGVLFFVIRSIGGFSDEC